MVRVTLELEDRVAAQLARRASAEGLTVEDLLARAATAVTQDPFEFFGCGAADVSATDADQLLARGFGRPA